MAQYAKLGICKTQLNPLDCDGAIDPAATPLVYCGFTVVDENPVLTDGLTIRDPSGMPNRDCVQIDIDPEIDRYEIVLTTCSLFDSKVDALFGYSDEMVMTDGTSIGSMARKKQGQNCICECGDEACVQRVGLTTWSLAVCPNGDPHPDGKYVVTVYPALQFRPNTFTRTTSRELNGRQYLAISKENEMFGQGPGGIIPSDFVPFDRCRYEFLTDECPPGDCDCGLCGADSADGSPLV